jgi:glutathione S-transferase
VLDTHLAEREWLCGRRLSLADLAIGAPLADWQRARLPLQPFAHIGRWFQQLGRLECWQGTE